ncbi:MAG: cytochrome c oxidase subunit 3 [bacterium]|nr:cytochrome oxidase subunit III [Gemmatimonadota bacterium]
METTAHIADRWGGGTCPFDAGWKKVMMWSFIVTDGLLFAGFLGGYGYARTMATVWPDQATVFTLPFIAAMTFVLISSSATMASAVWSARHNQRAAAVRYVWLTLAGAVLFLGMQAYEWTHLINEGATLSSNPWGDPLFGAYFFVTTGFHGSHVLIGAIVLLVLGINLARGRTTTENVEMAGLYWHFVDLVWVFIFTCYYLL